MAQSVYDPRFGEPGGCKPGHLSKMKKRVQAYRKSARPMKRVKSISMRQPTGPIGNFQPIKLCYADYASLDPGVSSTAVQVYRGNSCYDPDYTSTGHQPMGFDQLMGLFYKYIITGFSYEVIFSTTNTTATNTTLVCVVPTVVSTTSTDINRYIEMPGSKHAMLEGRAGNVTRQIFRGYVDVAKFFGRTRQQLLSDDTYMGGDGTNPDQVVYLHVVAAGYSGQDAAAVATYTKLTFYGQVRDPRFVDSS